jgi:hypothetical protein
MNRIRGKRIGVMGAVPAAAASVRLRLFLLTLVLTAGFTSSVAGSNCVVADPVHLAIDGIEYNIPAALQPFYSPAEAIKTRDYFPNNYRTKQYCQASTAVPPTVRIILFRARELTAWAEQNPRYGRLAGVYPLSVEAAANAPPRTLTDGEIIDDGLFRRVDHGRARYELVSTRPLLFGAPIFADCLPAGTERPSISCRISGRLPVGSLITVDVHNTMHPRESWPQLLEQVEQFLTSLMNAGSHQR